MNCSYFYLVAAVLLLLLFHQRSCDAAATQAPQKAVEISEKSAPVAEAEAKKDKNSSVKKALTEDPLPGPKDSMTVVSKGSPDPVAPPKPQLKAPAAEVPGSRPTDHVEQTRMSSDMDFPGQAVVYILVGITSTAILLLVMRVYRLRLSRAERKYGVQGDRANQELTPLPMAIEDVNSDDEDHTVFEVNRQNIRIL
ncbi:uncharacterized protein LOC128255975 isoform X1 [Drosophila gunungcola]|uniref:Uncharacterized protein n=1 Tax=Drosophila gunungcola TaxID=103775 RepID=A0A9Q0BMK9_9MUSC|nr:uncharacterized protein LOC128255975 isoform X1 [Drosophila gunungcola]KAI8037130.1 hypothetical protein M5D96_009877 [Drosophila gunungcola]